MPKPDAEVSKNWGLFRYASVSGVVSQLVLFLAVCCHAAFRRGLASGHDQELKFKEVPSDPAPPPCSFTMPIILTIPGVRLRFIGESRFSMNRRSRGNVELIVFPEPRYTTSMPVRFTPMVDHRSAGESV